MYENDATGAGGNQGTVQYSGGTHSMFNCTIADNTADDNAGVVTVNSASLTLHNSIIYGNTADDLHAFNSSDMILDYCIYGTDQDQTTGTYSITNFSTSNPLFVDAAGDNYRPSASSPAIDNGDATNVSTIDINNDSRTAPNEDVGCFEGPAPLPVELISFYGVAKKEFNVLFWETASEQNSEYFIVQKSLEGKKFESLDKVRAAGNSNSLNAYQLNDYKYSKKLYYRLKQVDFDGTVNYSESIYLERKKEYHDTIEFYPNPTSGKVSITFNTKEKSEIQIFIYDETGRRVLTQKIAPTNTDNYNIIDISFLPKGLYTASILSNKGKLHNYKIVKTM